MKLMRYLIPILLLGSLLGCLTQPADEVAQVDGRESAPEPSMTAERAKSLVDSMDLFSLTKIDEGLMPRPVVGIMQDSDKVEKVDIDLSGILSAPLASSGRVTLVDRNQLEAVISEQKLALSGMISSDSIEIGQLTGADYMITAEALQATELKEDKLAYDLLTITVKVGVSLVNVNTGEVFYSADRDGVVREKLVTDADGNLVSGVTDSPSLYAAASRAALEALLPDLLARFPLFSFVLKVTGEEVTSDLSSATDAEAGDYVAYIRPLGAVAHPVTGEVISMDVEFLGYGMVVSLGQTTGKISLIEGAVSPSDVVVLLN